MVAYCTLFFKKANLYSVFVSMHYCLRFFRNSDIIKTIVRNNFECTIFVVTKITDMSLNYTLNLYLN